MTAHECHESKVLARVLRRQLVEWGPPSQHGDLDEGEQQSQRPMQLAWRKRGSGLASGQEAREWCHEMLDACYDEPAFETFWR